MPFMFGDLAPTAFGESSCKFGRGPHLLFGNIRPYERVHKQKNLITRSNGKKYGLNGFTLLFSSIPTFFGNKSVIF